MDRVLSEPALFLAPESTRASPQARPLLAGESNLVAVLLANIGRVETAGIRDETQFAADQFQCSGPVARGPSQICVQSHRERRQLAMMATQLTVPGIAAAGTR